MVRRGPRAVALPAPSEDSCAQRALYTRCVHRALCATCLRAHTLSFPCFIHLAVLIPVRGWRPPPGLPRTDATRHARRTRSTCKGSARPRRSWTRACCRRRSLTRKRRSSSSSATSARKQPRAACLHRRAPCRRACSCTSRRPGKRGRLAPLARSPRWSPATRHPQEPHLRRQRRPRRAQESSRGRLVSPSACLTWPSSGRNCLRSSPQWRRREASRQ
jgi:hypothetical protein